MKLLKKIVKIIIVILAFLYLTVVNIDVGIKSEKLKTCVACNTMESQDESEAG